MDGDVREKLRETRLFAPPERLVVGTTDATVSTTEEDGEEEETSSSTDQDHDQESVVESVDLTTAVDSGEAHPTVTTIDIELPDAPPRPTRSHDEQMPSPAPPPPCSPIPTKEYDLDQFLASEPPAKRHGPQFTRHIRATIESLTAAVEEDNKQVEQCLEALAKARYAYTACLSKRTEHANELTMFTQLKRMIEYLSPEIHPHNSAAAAAIGPATTNST